MQVIKGFEMAERDNKQQTESQAISLGETPCEMEELTHTQTRRNFLKKYGKLAAVTPLALTALMSPKTSAAPDSNGSPCRPDKPGNGGNPNCPTNEPGGFR